MKCGKVCFWFKIGKRGLHWAQQETTELASLFHRLRVEAENQAPNESCKSALLMREQPAPPGLRVSFLRGLCRPVRVCWWPEGSGWIVSIQWLFLWTHARLPFNLHRLDPRAHLAQSHGLLHRFYCGKAQLQLWQVKRSYQPIRCLQVHTLGSSD